MRTKRVGVVAVGLIVGLSVLGGCSKKVAPEDLKKELTTGTSAMSQEQANCIVDGLVAKGVPLENYSTPSTDEQAKLTQVVTECITKTVSAGK